MKPKDQSPEVRSCPISPPSKQRPKLKHPELRQAQDEYSPFTFRSTRLTGRDDIGKVSDASQVYLPLRPNLFI